jgi:ATP-dependent helicase HrpB
MQNQPLPIDKILPELAQTLAQHPTVILQAEPGAGKTTRVPLALMEQDYIQGKILLLEPRRVAARSAAQYMAQLLGESVGQRVGYSMRMDRRVSRNTKVEVITEGLLTRRLISDPELSGVSLVIFDEFHERSIHTDLGLALCREVAALRDEPLRLLVMSATLDTDKLSSQLDNAPVLSSPGRTFPIEIHRAKSSINRFELLEALERRCRSALAVEGDVLVFLPGRAEIRQLERRLNDLWHDKPEIRVRALYSGVNDASIAQLFNAAPAGQKRFILGTSIAQTSITLPGVACVIDSGLERRPIFDRRLGLSRLSTERISAATATQRAGRAGRVRAGICYQLWSDDQQSQLIDHDRPQITQVDLSDTLLLLLSWGVSQIDDLEWIERPSETLWRAALEQLTALGAIDWRDQRPTLSELGKRMCQIPAEPRVARLLLGAESLRASTLGAQLAAIISDPPRQAQADLQQALEQIPRNKQLSKIAKRFEQLLSEQGYRESQDPRNAEAREIADLLLPAYSDRIAQCVDQQNGRFRLTNGTAVRLDPTDPLCLSPYLICVDLGGRDDHAELRLSLALPVNIELIKTVLSEQIQQQEELRWEGEHLRAIKLLRLGKLELERSEAQSISDSARASAWCERIRKEGLNTLPTWQNLAPWLARVRYLARNQERTPEPVELPLFDDATLLKRLDEWLVDALRSIKLQSELGKIDLKTQLLNILPWQITQWLDQYAPQTYTAPSGRSVKIDYTAEIPRISLKLQEMFGEQASPTTGLGLPIRVELLSPAGRPLAMTTDLAHFWHNIYPEVRKENRGRYAKHPWPEDPLKADASHLTNAALRRKSTG